ncbi:NUDIX domain-containing protein [Patescibacteria group bacterium]
MKGEVQVTARAIVPMKGGLVMLEQEDTKLGRIRIFPGGGIEFGETILQAAEREVKEETTLRVKGDRIIYIREMDAPGQHGIEFYVLCKHVSGKLKLGYDPEFSTKKQLLREAKIIKPADLAKSTNWFPEQLHKRIAKDAKKKFKVFEYLGGSKMKTKIR